MKIELYNNNQKDAIVAAYRATLAFREEAKALGLSPVTSLENDLFLGIYGHYLEESFLKDITNRTPQRINEYFNKKLAQIRVFRNDRPAQIRKNIADLKEELAQLEGRSDD